VAGDEESHRQLWDTVEYYPIFSHGNYGATRFDPTTDDILIGGEGGVPWNTGATASKKGFAPRFGLAYRLGSRPCFAAGTALPTIR